MASPGRSACIWFEKATVLIDRHHESCEALLRRFAKTALLMPGVGKRQTQCETQKQKNEKQAKRLYASFPFIVPGASVVSIDTSSSRKR